VVVGSQWEWTNRFYLQAQLFAALGAGVIADRVSRRAPLRLGIIVGVLAIVTLWLAMFATFSTKNDAHAYWTAAFGLLLWGTFRGVTLAPVDALFADSVATSKRAKYQTRKFVATLVGATMGPFLAVLLFKYFGDTWTKSELRVVIAAGTAFAVIPLVSLLRLHDEHALDVAASGPVLSLQDDKNDAMSRKIRLLCFSADLLFGLASGMTIRFFPLFFRNKTNLSPGEVNAVTIVTTFVMIFGSTLSQKMADRMGRMPVILVYKGLGVALLFVMALRKDLWKDWEIIVPIYVARTVLMNSTAPLHKSILMDHCCKELRARYSALDSVVSFGWSGSALLGGILADKHGFGYTFLITAVLQFIGLIFLGVLALYVNDNAAKQQNQLLQPESAGSTSSASVRSSTEQAENNDDEEEEEVTEEYRLISEAEDRA
jgi:MFS family permease